jgi:hypothetical protein
VPQAGFDGPLGSWLHPSGRHRGLGHPLHCESWLYRPFSAGWFMGMVQGSPLVHDGRDASGDFRGGVGQQRGFFGGYRLGWDFDYYWGCETRFGFGSIELFDTAAAKQAQQLRDAHLAPAIRNRYEHRRDTDLFVWDLDLLYYPWGDATWRPYLMIGLGTTHVNFEDRMGHTWKDTVFGMPLAVGLKYRCNDWLALRFEIADNMAFGGGSGLETLHNLSITGGMEVRFGGTRKAYWPWNPGRYYW